MISNTDPKGLSSQSQQSPAKNALILKLANYNLPYFLLEKVARECDSELVKKGKITTILGSMNESALTRLHKIFVQCENDEAGEFSDYRFAVFISSKIHSKLMFDQTITGESGADYKVKVAVFGGQGLVAVGENKSEKEKVSIEELLWFNKMVKDVSRSKEGENMLYAFYGSSDGYETGYNKVFVGNRKTKTIVDKYGNSIPKAISLLEFRDKNTRQIFTAPF